MTEQVTYIKPSELTHISIQCLNCYCTVEIPIRKSADLLSSQRSCKNCNTDIVNTEMATALENVGKLMESLSKESRLAVIRFVDRSRKS